jgi:hypothetical protein
MQQEMRAPARCGQGFARQLGDPAFIDALDALYSH